MNPGAASDSVWPLLQIRNLRHEYRTRNQSSGSRQPVVCLRQIDLEIRPGTSVAIAGESGCGKSTLAKCIARVEPPAAGEIVFQGKNIWSLRRDELNSFRRQVQLIYQESATSLNPRFTNEQVVAEPLVIQGNRSRQDLREEVLRQLEHVGLPAEVTSRRPLELSGGQRQRLAIARALILKPRLLIFDEALTGLDLLVQQKILDLLRTLQMQNSLTYLFITHDLGLAQEMAGEVAVLHDGRIVERICSADLFTFPRHDYTRRLVHSAQLLKSVSASATR